MIPKDCEPAESEMVYEFLSGPDEKGRRVFFLYWQWEGMARGQVFKSALHAEFQTAQRESGKTIREIWR